MKGLIIFLIIMAVLWVAWPFVTRWIRAWVMRRLQNKAEDYIRQAAGMPPRQEAKSRAKKANSRRGGSRQEAPQGTASGRRRASSSYGRRRGPIIPKEYAVDVEYVEIKEYSSATVIGETPQGERVEWHESQVTDAEWVEIK